MPTFHSRVTLLAFGATVCLSVLAIVGFDEVMVGEVKTKEIYPPFKTTSFVEISQDKMIEDLGMTNTQPPVQHCCFGPSVNVTEFLTREYLENQAKIASSFAKYNPGGEFEKWQEIDKILFQRKKSDDCVAQWRLTVLEQAKGSYLMRLLADLQDKDLRPTSPLNGFGYIEDNSSLPRLLFLGDSISRGAWTKMMGKFGTKANIHGAPTNCMFFSRYKENLPVWLGSCPWDLIQFNVGMHFHPQNGDDLEAYQSGLEYVLQQLRSHSPHAHLVIALTTPSPFDSPDTSPDEATCPNFHKFHKQGYISKLNGVVRQVAAAYNASVSDRYAAVQPELKRYQYPCDIHFNGDGNEAIVGADWDTAARLLGLSWKKIESWRSCMRNQLNFLVSHSI